MLISSSSSGTAGKITLPSTILQFWDLGGQRGIRNIWHRYFDDCHAVIYVIDAEDRERLSEGWEVFGMSFVISSSLLPFLRFERRILTYNFQVI